MIEKVDVFANNTKVGTLALTKDNKVAFQYADEWINNGFSINPFKLPLTKKVYIASSPYFKGLFGVFSDSLPDSYGELLLDRYLRRKGIDLNELNALDRLSYIGKSGMGILEYAPDLSEEEKLSEIDFDFLQKECNALLDSKEVNDIVSLYRLGGSSGGARPKSLIKYKGEDWIVKFSSKFDPKNITEIEYKYMSLAKEAGINIPDIDLIETNSGNKYYLIKRFDRINNKKVHMISVAALLECDFKAPSLDYNDLIKLTRVLTNKDEDVIEMFTRMVFNVLISNQDDHAKNFAFIYDDLNKIYRLSPAYDITPGKTYFGEHTTSVNGKGKDISTNDLLDVAAKNKIKLDLAKQIINKIKKVITTSN
jgi:serine/threonine-protein kinase HipA